MERADAPGTRGATSRTALHAFHTSPFEGLSEDLRRAFLATAHLRRVVPVWSGGPVGTRLPLGDEAGIRGGEAGDSPGGSATAT